MFTTGDGPSHIEYLPLVWERSQFRWVPLGAHRLTVLPPGMGEDWHRDSSIGFVLSFDKFAVVLSIHWLWCVLTIFVNCRKRADPPVPKSYLKNLTQAIFTVTAAGLLSASPPEISAPTIQKSIEMHNTEAIDECNKNGRVH